MNSNRRNKAITLPQSDDWIQRVRDKSEDYMTRYESCTQGILSAFMEEFNINDPMVMRAAGAMFGGMVSSLTCGIHTAAMMVLGLLVGREELEQGLDGLLPIYAPAQDLIKQLNDLLGSSSCKELTGTDFTDPDQAMAFRVTGDYKTCIARVGEGAEQIARFLKQLDEKGELFRVP